MSFAALEDRANAAVIRWLANATATIVEPADLAGSTIDVIFDAAYQVVDVDPGASASTPTATMQDIDIPALLADALLAGDEVALEIRGSTWNVVEPLPDGTGLTVLRLRK